MQKDRSTRSERLFEELCNAHGVAFQRLPERQKDKQPDYELTLSGQRVVVEVKQVEPNEEDEEYHKKIEAGVIFVQHRNPDLMAKRVRNLISTSRDQFASYLERHPSTPSMLVVFDAAENWYTDPYAILVALYGWEQATFSVPNDGRSPYITDVGPGKRNNRELRADKNTHLSALATLHERCELVAPHNRFLELSIYHNRFAQLALDASLWKSDYIRHQELAEKIQGQFQSWVEI